MNTTFTTYAEKKAKQFLNLLQGYTKGMRMTAILMLLVVGTSNAWAGEATIYVTGAHIYKDAWDQSTSEVRIGYNYNIQNSSDGWTGHKAMTRTDDTYNGYPIYSYKVSSSTNYAQIYFYHYKNGSQVSNSDYGAGGWIEFTNNADKVYLGYIDNAHQWVDLCDNNTYYFLKNGKAESWENVYAYSWDGGINNNWPGTLMSNTGKTYNGIAIYSTTIYCTYTGAIFNQGNSTDQSGDQDISNCEGKIFDYENNKWIEYTYDVTVTFSANGHGTAPSAKTVLKGNTITAPTDPTATGYTFGGWYKESGCTNAFNFNTAINADITLYAKWTANTYAVTLNPQSGTGGTTSVTATYDSAMPAITKPTRTGYTFKGYYDATSGGTQYYKADASSARTWNKTAATTLYAQWTPAKYTINYKDQNNANFSGSHATGYPTQHTYGTATTLKTASKTGYTFGGWFTNSECTGSAVTSLGATAYTSNITLYAKWTAVPTAIYLKPSATWKYADARFAIHYWVDDDDDNGWVDMTTVGCDDEYYTAEIPAGYTNFKFVRLDPAKTENNWSNRWCETGNLTIPADGKNLFDMTQMYLDAQQGWTNDGARFAAYFYVKDDDSKTKWMSMSHVKDNIYKCDIPDDYNFDWVIFGRMDGNNSTNGWDNGSVWNQTSDLELTTYGVTHGNFFTITNIGDYTGDVSDGSWSWNDIAWSTLDLPTITITNENEDYGSITVTTVGGTEITSETEVDWDTEVIVSVQPKAGYAVESSSINIGGNSETVQSGKTYTICNTTTIEVSFEKKGEWYLAGIDDNWEVREEYKLIDGKILVELDGKVTKSFKLVQKVGDVTTWYGGGFGFKSLYPIGTLTEADGEGNHCTIETVHDGDYLFVWDENTKRLTIEYPNVIFLHGTFNDWKDKASHALHDRDAKVYLNGSENYAFKVVEKGIYYTTKDDSKALSTQITMDDPTEHADNCTYYASITGLHTFHFDKETRILTVTPPTDNTLAVGDYRLQYTNGTNSYYTDHVKKRTSGDGVNTVSLFILNAGTTPRVILQRYSSGTWTDVTTYYLSNMTLDDEMTDEHGGVWNFIISQTNNGDDATVSNANNPERYTGKYYIRTDAADGGWNEYPIPENEIFFSSYARDNEGFDYYYCKYISGGTNVKYNIANDYNSKLNPTDYNGTTLINNDGTMPADGNVRFMWNSRTNELVGRAYLDGSSTDNFLRITDATNLYDADGKNSITTAKFTDLQNWIYQVDVQASNSTLIKLIAKYNNNEQYFKGNASDDRVQLLTSTDTDELYKIRLIYNFKTNHLVCAWLAGGETITNDEELGADMMIVRRNQEQAQQLHFNPNSTRLSVKTVYAVTTFSYDFITDESKTQYERALYWISFPFEVKISDVFGFGEYGEHWIMQYYDGVARATYGLFEDSGTYWKYITNTEEVLSPNVGYVLTLDLDKVKNSFLHGAENVSLYFPSTTSLENITGTLPTEVEVPAHECKIIMPDANEDNKRDRRIYDSHWNMIGVPVFADVEGFPTKPGCVNNSDLSFYYEYLPTTNTYQATNATADFQTMYGYMVQFAGIINWSAPSATPASLAARRNAASTLPEKVSLRLEIAQDEEMADQTFVQLQQEGATAEFDMNLDLTKIINSGANIYTLAGEQRIQTAGNALPMGEAVVPVGVKIATEGEYTLRMPDGTEGMVVELIDYERDITTNLLLFDYTVTLPAGSNESRFALHIQPQKDVTTGVENVGDKVKGIEKYLIDGKLIIRTAEGAVYDAQGHVVQ